jgi:peptide chain release factor 1
MYTKFVERVGLRMEVIDIAYTDLKGLRYAIFSVEGENAYRLLRFESGTHRVQRVPRTEASGRIHTSAATVAVLPQIDDIDIDVKKEELKIETLRAGGPGGQHVNKTDSAVRITHLPSQIVVFCQTERSQHRNRDLAMKLLRARLFDLKEKKQQAERSQLRKSQIGSGDRSEKVRTYNFPQGRVTDHRIEYTIHKLEQFLDGDIMEVVQKLDESDRKKRLAVAGDNKNS